jgi:hypothetical protein
MANYSATEIRAFKLKDILNSRMSALKASATLYDGVGCDLGHTTDTVLADADKYFEWLRQDQDKPDVGPTPDTSLGSDTGTTLGQVPEPTLQQKKVIDAIAGKLGKVQADLKSHILDWANETHGQRSYPTKLDSVDTFINWYRKSN